MNEALNHHFLRPTYPTNEPQLQERPASDGRGVVLQWSGPDEAQRLKAAVERLESRSYLWWIMVNNDLVIVNNDLVIVNNGLIMV